VYSDEAGDSVEQDSEASLAPDEVPGASQTEASIRMAAQLINVIDVLKQFASRSTDETMVWSVVDRLRAEVVELGERSDSLLNELVLLYQAIEVVRGQR
jgi:hypothetical protein